MNLDKNKKVLFLTDIDNGLEHILQEVTNIQPENMLTIQSYGTVISHPYGDIMRSIIIAIYQENIEEIFVVGTKDKSTLKFNVLSQPESMENKIQNLDYFFQNCMPEFPGGTVDDWLNGKENSNDNIKKSVETICHHPLVPLHVKVQGLVVVNNNNGKFSIEEVPTNKTVSNPI